MPQYAQTSRIALENREFALEPLVAGHRLCIGLKELSYSVWMLLAGSD